MVGVVTNPEQEGPETIAALQFTAAAGKYRELFSYLMSEKELGEDPPLEFNIFEDWFIEDENGVKKAISTPAIYDGGTNLSWRWKRY
ncbi:hypothetical protein BH11CYA1_BH11CYA1_41180 [soil metagenome]